jgi:transitional endoplasmic reticulum ATPase
MATKAASQVLGAGKKKITDIVEIRRHDGPLMVPEGLTLQRLDKVIHRQMEYEEQDVQIHAVIDRAFFWDGAYALNKVLLEKYGLAQSVNTVIQTFFGEQQIPPTMLSIATGIDKVEQVPYGRFSLPGIDGYLESAFDRKDGRIVFAIGGQVKRKNEPQVQEIVERVKEYLRHNSLYRGKAISVKWKDDDGEPIRMPEPRFLRLRPELEHQLIFSDATMAAIQTNIFTPIKRSNEARELGMSLKRGVLLHGKFGTGKSMTSAVSAAIATQHGWTFIGVESADELADSLRLAELFEPCIVFCEDIDRTMSGEDRTISMDEILNLIDGIESKNRELMVVLTTNEVEKINQALLRPGRLDAVIEIPPPDAKAAEGLLRLYGGSLIPEGEDIAAAAEQVEGSIPAVLRELVDRSKWSALKLTSPGEPFQITGKALLEVAAEMTQQMDLLRVKQPDTRSDREKAADRIALAIEKGKPEATNGVHEAVAAAETV